MLARREIDKVRGTGGSIGEKGIEDPARASGTNVNVIDNIVHFDLGSTPGSVAGMASAIWTKYCTTWTQP